MGLKATESYRTADDLHRDGDLPRASRGWLGSVSSFIEEIRDNGFDRVSLCFVRMSRNGREIAEEYLQPFSRGLASGSRKHILILLLLVLLGFVLVHWIVLKDSNLNANLVPAPALCASQDDLYDTASHLCRVGNKYAFWFLKRKDWVQCAPNLPGYKLLQRNADMNGNFWYSYKQSAQIKQFYDTCIPECATDEDVYDSKRDLCRVTDGVLVTWLNGDGQKCATGTKGERAIRTATASLSHANGYFYAPDASGKVRRLLESCHSSCAKGDVLLHDKRHCQVMNSLALRFISTGVGTCDRNLQARRMISTMGTTRDVQGAYMYPKELGNAIEQFYLSCMQGWNRKGRAGIRTIPHSSETVGGKPLRDDAKQRRQARNERRWEEAVLQSDYN